MALTAKYTGVILRNLAYINVMVKGPVFDTAPNKVALLNRRNSHVIQKVYWLLPFGYLAASNIFLTISSVKSPVSDKWVNPIFSILATTVSIPVSSIP